MHHGLIFVHFLWNSSPVSSSFCALLSHDNYRNVFRNFSSTNFASYIFKVSRLDMLQQLFPQRRNSLIAFLELQTYVSQFRFPIFSNSLFSSFDSKLFSSMQIIFQCCCCGSSDVFLIHVVTMTTFDKLDCFKSVSYLYLISLTHYHHRCKVVYKSITKFEQGTYQPLNYLTFPEGSKVLPKIVYFSVN